MAAGGVHFKLSSFDGGNVILQRLDTHERRRVSEHDLLQSIRDGQVHCAEASAIKPLSEDGETIKTSSVRTVSAAALSDWTQKLAWLDALQRRGITKLVVKPYVRVAINQLASGELRDTKQYSISTLYKTDLKIRKCGGDRSAAIPDYEKRGGPGISRIDTEAAKIAIALFDTIKADRDDPIIKENVYAEIYTEIRKRNSMAPERQIAEPGATTLARLLALHIDAAEIHARNHGESAASVAYRNNSHARDTAQRPLEVSEYDDLDTRVFLIDEGLGLPFGRGYLTNGIDQCTLVPLGCAIGHEFRSYDSAIEALIHSLLPKAHTGEDAGWVGYGAQGSIILDNARYNFSSATKHQATTLNLLLGGARPYGPTEKSTIEHFNHIIRANFLKGLPGWGGNKGDRDALDEGIASAILTVGEFRKRYFEWVVGEYLNKPGDDGYTPRQRWEKFYSRHRPAVRFGREQLALMRLRPRELTFRESGGLLRLGLRYSSDALAKVRGQQGMDAEVQCYTDGKDLSYLMVRQPRSRDLLRVPCIEDPRYIAGLNERQQQLIYKTARADGHKNPAIPQMVAARNKLRRMVSQLKSSKKLRNRGKAKQIGDIPDMPNVQEQRADLPPSTVVTELEYQILQLESVEADCEGEWV
jgi:hypothetical protein